MTETTALERRVADAMQERAGPVRPVDDGAVFERVASRSKGWGFTLFSALKFAAAGIIVTLFGGFLLSGFLTNPQADDVAPAAVTETPSPMTTAGLLASLATDEIEPGVLAIADGEFRGLSGVSSVPDGGVTVGPDGAVWVYWGTGRFGQVGEDHGGDMMAFGTREGWDLLSDGWDEYDFDTGDLQAGPDGRLWYRADDGVRTLRDGDWVQPEGADRSFARMAVDHDGDAWVSTQGNLWRVTPDGTSSVQTPPPSRSQPRSLRVTGDGIAYLVVEDFDGTAESLLRFDDAGWQEIPLPTRVAGAWNSDLMDVGAGGTLWVATQSETIDVDEVDGRLAVVDGLARYDDGEWSTFELADAGMTWNGRFCFITPCRMMRASPDGSVWFDASDEDPEGNCDGLARFDGTTWSHALDGTCITDMDFAPDGAAWVVAPPRMYVVLPEAMTEVQSRRHHPRSDPSAAPGGE